jgi:hypothetical protein
MFHYTGKKIAGFVIAQSIQYQGDESIWVVTQGGATSNNQRELNVFADGIMLYTHGDYSRIMNPGESGMDHTFDKQPANVPISLKVISPYATRYCTSPVLTTDNCTRDVYVLQPGDTHSEPTDTCIFVLSGEINFCSLAMKSISYRLLPANEVLTATIASKILINRIVV